MSVTLIASAALVGAALPFRTRLLAWLRGLIEWEGDGGSITIGSPGAIAALGVMALSLSYAYVVIGGVTSAGGGQAGGSIAGTPGTPTIVVAKPDTSTMYVTFSTFQPNGADTQDSISVTVRRAGTTDTLFHAVSGAQITDTVVDNADLKKDSTYSVFGRQKGTDGGWSAYDSVSVVNTTWPIRTNEPVGMTELWDWDGTFITPPTGWDAWSSDSITLVSVAGPDGTTRSTMRFHWVTGANGAGVTAYEPFTPTATTFYISYWIKWNSTFGDSVGSMGQKVPGYVGTTAGTNAAYSTREDDSSLLYYVQATTAFPCSIGSGWPALGTWTHYEEVLTAESPNSTSDNGTVKVYINGTLVCNASGVNWQNSGTPGFNGYEWYNYRNAANTGYNFYDVAEFYGSGK